LKKKIELTERFIERKKREYEELQKELETLERQSGEWKGKK
jgi:hypothetical protein